MEGKMRKLIIMTFVIASIASACQLEEEGASFDPQEKMNYESDITSEGIFGVVESLTAAGQTYAENFHSGGKLAESDELKGAIIEIGGDKYDGRMEIDFGVQGIEGPGGHIRKGKVVIEWDGYRFEEGSVVYTILKEFYIDDIKIDGTRKSLNTNATTDSLTFDVDVMNGKLTWSDSTTTTWHADRQHHWYVGGSAISVSITGTAHGFTRMDKSYTSQITEALVFTAECAAQGDFLPVQGSKTVQVDNMEPITLDYGSGQCDASVSVSIGNKSNDVHVF